MLGNLVSSTPRTPEMIQHMLVELDRNLVRELTEWEDSFVTSIRNQVGNNKELSDKQFSILERIYAEKTG